MINFLKVSYCNKESSYTSVRNLSVYINTVFCLYIMYVISFNDMGQ